MDWKICSGSDEAYSITLEVRVVYNVFFKVKIGVKISRSILPIRKNKRWDVLSSSLNRANPSFKQDRKERLWEEENREVRHVWIQMMDVDRWGYAAEVGCIGIIVALFLPLLVVSFLAGAAFSLRMFPLQCFPVALDYIQRFVNDRQKCFVSVFRQCWGWKWRGHRW